MAERRKFIVVTNPKSGDGSGHRVAENLSELHLPYQLAHLTASQLQLKLSAIEKEDECDLFPNCDSEEQPVFVLAGGDGTNAANLLALYQAVERMPRTNSLSVVFAPFGSANVMARQAGFNRILGLSPSKQLGDILETVINPERADTVSFTPGEIRFPAEDKDRMRFIWHIGGPLSRIIHSAIEKFRSYGLNSIPARYFVSIMLAVGELLKSRHGLNPTLLSINGEQKKIWDAEVFRLPQLGPLLIRNGRELDFGSADLLLVGDGDRPFNQEFRRMMIDVFISVIFGKQKIRSMTGALRVQSLREGAKAELNGDGILSVIDAEITGGLGGVSSCEVDPFVKNTGVTVNIFSRKSVNK